MYGKIGKETIAKTRYSFKKGYLQVTIAQKHEVREKLMKVLGITRLTYFSSILNAGITDIGISKYKGISDVFNEYGITDVWDETSD